VARAWSCPPTPSGVEVKERIELLTTSTIVLTTSTKES